MEEVAKSALSIQTYSLLVQIAAAILTLIVAVVALFGDVLRRKILPPKLTLQLSNSDGVLVPVEVISPSGERRSTKGRYYHARVNNRRRISPANHVQVLLLQVEEPDASGVFSSIWVGEMALRWRQSAHAGFFRIIGSPAEIDLLSAVQGIEQSEGKWVELHPAIPIGNLEYRKRQGFHWRLKLQARSDESDSIPLNVDISWDGVWAEDPSEMKRHLVVKEPTQGTQRLG